MDKDTGHISRLFNVKALSLNQNFKILFLVSSENTKFKT
jgi:hypothetical protein